MKRTRRMKGKANRVPLNILKPLKGHKRTRPHVSKEIVQVHTSFIKYSEASSSQLDSIDNNFPHEIIDENDSYGQGSNPPSVHQTYTRRKARAAEKWREVRAGIEHILLWQHSLNKNTLCFQCTNTAVVRCQQCGPYVYCVECANLLHENRNFHHSPEIWKDDCFIPMKLLPALIPLNSHGHNCRTARTVRNVTCFSLEGIPRQINIEFCKCQLDAHRIIELGYWPATPSRPVLAFSTSLMDWMETLLLECQVAVQDFTSALKMLITEKFQLVPCSVYPVIIDSFEEYRHYKENLRIMKEPMNLGDVLSCPACPKENGVVTLSIDANFGLCRKKNAGTSVREPLSGNSMFSDQGEVNDYVLSSISESVPTATDKDCSDFLAGHALRSRSRFSALDETGIMGVVCKHEYPICFINLYHGEKLAYAVYLLELLMKMYPNHKIQLMYDIACLLCKHLQGHNRDDILDKFEFAVPVFHAYGHSAKCQVVMNPRNIVGFGLSDGEGVERLWSYMRRFAPMSKEMRPSHRIDVLSDALKHYARSSYYNIGTLLCKRMQHAKQCLEEANHELQNLRLSSPAAITFEDICYWDAEVRENIGSQPSIHENSPTWQEQYICHLETADKIKDAMQSMNCDTPNAGMLLLISNLKKIESRLLEIEKSHQITNRWAKNFQEYLTTKACMESKIKQSLRSKMTSEARERWFLLRMKSKYADGQKIAIRLSRRITVVTQSLRKSLADYNAGLDSSSQLTWEQVTDLSQQIHDGCLFTNTSIPSTIKSQAIRLHNIMMRAEEEIGKLKEEMFHCIEHFISVYSCLIGKIEELKNNPNSFSCGHICLLKQSLRKYRVILSTLFPFAEHIDISVLNKFLLSLDDDLENVRDNPTSEETSLPEEPSLPEKSSLTEESIHEETQCMLKSLPTALAGSVPEYSDDSCCDEYHGNEQLELYAMDSLESEEDEELEVQYWRMDDYQCQLYLQSTQGDLLSSLLTDQDREILKKIKTPIDCVNEVVGVVIDGLES